MTRKGFIASIAALIAAPFIPTQNKEEKTDLKIEIKLNQASIDEIHRKIDEAKQELSKIQVSGKMKIKGDDLKLIM